MDDFLWVVLYNEKKVLCQLKNGDIIRDEENDTRIICNDNCYFDYCGSSIFLPDPESRGGQFGVGFGDRIVEFYTVDRISDHDDLECSLADSRFLTLRA